MTSFLSGGMFVNFKFKLPDQRISSPTSCFLPRAYYPGKFSYFTIPNIAPPTFSSLKLLDVGNHEYYCKFIFLIRIKMAWLAVLLKNETP
jgi:hypothetical protein